MAKTGPRTKFSHWKKEGKFYVDDNGCHICTSIKAAPSGYYKTDFRGLSTHLHRRLFQEAHGVLARLQVVMHKCDNKSCINLEHMELGTNQKNFLDAIARKLFDWPRGEAAFHAKLTEKDVLDIRASPLRLYEIVKLYPGVTRSCISAILHRRSWKHLP